MQTKFIFILLQLYCLIFYTNGHLSYKYRNRNRSRGSLHNTHNAQALVSLAESPSSLPNNQLNLNTNHQSQIECDFLNHKETGCEEVGSRCDPITSKCVCKDSHPVRLLDFCLKLSRLNGPCYTSGQCAVVSNASCYIFGKEYDLETSSGGHNLGRLVKNWPLGVCKCRLGFAYNLTTNSCEKRVIGSWCNHDKHCLLRSLNSICDKKRGECECAWGTRYESKLDSCVPDTTIANSVESINGVNGHLNGFESSRQVYYLSKCEHDSDCSLTSTSTQQISSSSSSGISSTSSPAYISVPTVSSTVSYSSPQSIVQSSNTSSSISSNNQNLNSANLVHQSAVQIENNNLLFEQADQENQFNPIRYLHGHRRLKDSLKRLTNYHLRDLQCIRGRCGCPSLHQWDGGVHCKEPYDTQSSYNSSTHRHNRKNHNEFDEFDDENASNWQNIFMITIGSTVFAGFIFRFCYYRKGEDDDELSEGLRSPDLYAHKSALSIEHPFHHNPYNPVTVAFLSKPAANATSCGNHYGPGYISSSASGCYHEFDYGYDPHGSVCGATQHAMLNSVSLRGHHQANSLLGKPPNEEEEDAYLEQNPEERENYAKKETDALESDKYGCAQCGQTRNNNIMTNINHSVIDIQPTSQQQPQSCGCDCTNINNLVSKNAKSSIDTTLTRAILEHYGGNEILAGDSLNNNIGRDLIECSTPATTATTTCGRTSSGNSTTTDEDDENNKTSSHEGSNSDATDLKDEHLSSLLTQATNNLHTSFNKRDLGSEEDSNEDTSDEQIAILNRKVRKDPIKKWRPSTVDSLVVLNSSSDPSSSASNNNNSPSKNSNNNKSNVPLLLESQTEQFQIA